MNLLKLKNDSPFQALEELKIFMTNNRQINTYNNYFLHFKNFYKFIFNTENFKWINIINISSKNILEYQNYLKTNHTNTSINTIVAGIKKILVHLSKYNKEIKLPIIDNLKEFDIDKKPHLAFTEEEINKLIKYALESRVKPKIKALFIKCAYITALRKDCLLQLKKENLIHENNKYFIKTIDKNKQIEKEIPQGLYFDLINQPDYKIFNINYRTLLNLIKNFCKQNNLPLKTVHSIKKGSMNQIYKITKDIVATASHGGHSNINTSYNHYINKPNNTSMLFYQNKNSLENYTREELIQAIYDTNNKDIILNKLKN